MGWDTFLRIKFYRSIGVALLIAMGAISPAWAQSMSAGGIKGRVTDVCSGKIETLDARLTTAQSTLAKVLNCNQQGKFFDGSGCTAQAVVLPDHFWAGTELGFVKPDGTNGTAQELRGPAGQSTVCASSLGPPPVDPNANAVTCTRSGVTRKVGETATFYKFPYECKTSTVTTGKCAVSTTLTPTSSVDFSGGSYSVVYSDEGTSNGYEFVCMADGKFRVKLSYTPSSGPLAGQTASEQTAYKKLTCQPTPGCNMWVSDFMMTLRPDAKTVTATGYNILGGPSLLSFLPDCTTQNVGQQYKVIAPLGTSSMTFKVECRGGTQ